MSLLEKAKNIKSRNYLKYDKISDEEIELAIGWLTSQVTLSQVSRAMGLPPTTGNILYKISVFLKAGYDRGKLVIKK